MWTKSINTGVQEVESAREGVAVLLSDVWHSVVVKHGYVSTRILWIKFKFSMAKVCVVVGYGSNEEGEERDRFWNNMDRTEKAERNHWRLGVDFAPPTSTLS